MEIRATQTTEAIPTQPSSRRIRGTARIINISTKSRAASVMAHIVMDLDGTAKNKSPKMRYPVAKVVYAKAKKPDPRGWIIGGLTNMETSRNVHHMKLSANATSDTPRTARTLHRL